MKSKAYKIVTVVIFAVILVVLPILTFVFNPSEPRPFSENENRYLTAFPKLSEKTFKNEEFMNGFEDWFADRFFGREQWIKLRNATERLIGKVDVNGVYTAQDRMMEIWEGFDSDYIMKNLNALNSFSSNYPDIPVYFLLAPTSQEIYSDLFPASAPIGSQSDMLEFCRDALDKVQTINVMPTLKLHAQDYIYYRTDHHWTSYGAYLAYYDAAKVMGFKPSDLNEYDIEHASYSFRGTLYSKTLDDGVTPDVIDYYHPHSVKGITLTVLDDGEKKMYDSLYFREYLEVKDKYSSFMGPNGPYMDIETGVDGPSLLIFKDSYAHSLIPFLTAHFGRITVLDMRYIKTSINDFVDVNDYDSVLILYNAITFSQDKDIRRLNMG